MIHILGETFERAKRLKEKMQTNLLMVKDRLEVLGKYFFNKMNLLLSMVVVYFLN